MTTTPAPIQDLLRLAGKMAIVAGGALGIGYGIAYRLAAAGANVVIADLDGQAAEHAATDLVKAGFEATATQTKVAEERDVERMVATSAELYGDIDILVNNAGIYPNILVMNMETDDFTRVLNVNLLGVLLCTRLVAKHMIEHNHGGRIINITSIDALHPSSFASALPMVLAAEVAEPALLTRVNDRTQRFGWRARHWRTADDSPASTCRSGPQRIQDGDQIHHLLGCCASDGRDIAERGNAHQHDT
jgi:NAD(P)-dependent dehydrogenase (short-subunit alcohol dehydrogenase family)